MTKHRTLFASLAGVLAMSGLAYAYNTSFADLTKITTTSVSGHTGAEHEVEMGPKFLYALEWSEQNDDPCWFMVYGAEQSAGAWTSDTEEDHVGSCQKKSSSRKVVHLQTPGDGDARFIRSIQVCTSEKKQSADEKLKGIRIKAARLTSDGTLVSENAVESDQHTNCKTWEKEVSCPSGTAAVGMNLQVGSWGATSTGYRGISLDCAPVIVGTRRPS